MTALLSLPKEEIAERLIDMIKNLEKKIDELEGQLVLAHRKAEHGCYGFTCEECDKL